MKFKRIEHPSPAEAAREARIKAGERMASETTAYVTFTATTGRSRDRTTKTGKVRPGKTTSRTARQNGMIYGVQRKRLGARLLRVSAKDARTISQAASGLREKAKMTGRVRPYAEAVAAGIKKVVRWKIRNEKLVDSGQLLKSIVAKVTNV